ncbi:MAG TPA: HPr family phosphocarrier protein [Clostridiales bacterium]|jgi:phosphocarrier protein HPr|nr:HPr family phosphocarrier protein [Clostridiales bacterium]
MKSIKIHLSSIEDVKQFVNAASLADFEVDLISGRYIIDAKSIMGIFSLDLSKDIDLRAYCDDEAKLAAFFKQIEKFTV